MSKKTERGGKRPNTFLLAGGSLSIAAGLLHFVIIAGGAAYYRYFGAGEEMAQLSEQGSLMPGLVTAVIAFVLILWGLYAFSFAGILRDLPWKKNIVLIIGAIFTLRGVGVVPQIVMVFLPGGNIPLHDIVFSFVSLLIGICYLYGYNVVVKK